MHLHEEASRCLFCADAPCSKACKNADPAEAISPSKRVQKTK